MPEPVYPTPSNPSSGSSPMIRHAPAAGLGAAEEPKAQIRHDGQNVLRGAFQDNWKRRPVTTGQGASHVRSFHCKLTGETLENLDRQINEWLDAHPEYEIKMVTTCVGEWMGKIREPNLIVQVWV